MFHIKMSDFRSWLLYKFFFLLMHTLEDRMGWLNLLNSCHHMGELDGVSSASLSLTCCCKYSGVWASRWEVSVSLLLSVPNFQIETGSWWLPNFPAIKSRSSYLLRNFKGDNKKSLTIDAACESSIRHSEVSGHKQLTQEYGVCTEIPCSIKSFPCMVSSLQTSPISCIGCSNLEVLYMYFI